MNSADAPSPPTTIGAQLEWAAGVLETIGAPDPRKEAAALLGSVIGLPIAQLGASATATVAADQVDRFLAAIALRMRGDDPGS